MFKLKDICEKIGSGSTPRGGRESYCEEGISLIRSQNILDYEFSDSGLAHINDVQAMKLKNVIVEDEDVLLNITGDSVARVCMVDSEYLPARVNQHVCIIRANKSKVIPSYLLYYLVMNKKRLLQLAAGGATRNALTKDMINNLELELPSINEQMQMTDVLDLIQSKIKINNRINNNLEQQAKAIFANEFLSVETLPDGWKQSSLIDIADYLNGLAMQKYRPTADEVGVPVLKIKELRQGCCDDNSDVCSPNIKKEYIIQDGDVIFSWSGSLLVDFWCGGVCGLNQHLFKVTSKSYDKWFYYAWTKHHLDRFIAVAADKATTMGHIKRDELAKAEVMIPTIDDYNRIGSLLQPIYDLIISNRIENKKLAETRDSLLPKLMSGEIDMSEVDYE